MKPPKPLRMLVSFCVCGLVVQNMNAFGSLFSRYDKWSQTMRGFCGVRPDASRLADAVKMMLETLEQHLVDLHIKEVMDVVVKLTARVALRDCRGGTCQKLGRCTLCWRCRQASPMRISVMLADSNQQSMMVTWSGTSSGA